MITGLALLQCIYFMLPAYFGNMAPVMFKNRFSFLARPIDGGATWGNKRVLGDHKTWRGLILGIILAMIAAFVQSLLAAHPFFEALSVVSYDSWALLGFLMGLGALGGDMIKSLFKRRLNRKPGQPFVPFDQLDFVVGSLALSLLIVSLPLHIILTIIGVSFFLHIATNHTAFFLGIRNEKW